MTKKIYTLTHRLFLFVVLCAFMLSCAEDTKELFSESPTERTNQRVETLRKELIGSPEGWKLTYSPDTTKLGNFTFMMRFTDERTVEMISDFDAAVAPPTRSEYQLVMGSSVKLSFTTRNAIHALSNSADKPSGNFGNKGYGGEFEFIYYEKDGEDLLFRENRSGNSHSMIRFKKAAKQDWAALNAAKRGIGLDYILNNTYFLDRMEYMAILGNGTGPFYYYRTTARASRRLSWYPLSASSGQAGLVTPSFRILSFTPQGFTTSPLMLGGVPLSNFVYDENEGTLVATNGNIKALFITEQISSPQWYIDFSDGQGFDIFQYSYGTTDESSNRAPANSPAFLQLMKQVHDQLLQEEGVNLYLIGIQFNVVFRSDPNNTYFQMIYYLNEKGVTRYPLQYFTFEVTPDDRIVLKPAYTQYAFPDGWSTTNNGRFKEYLQPIADVFVHDEGVYINEIPYPNRTFAFKSLKDTSMVAGGFQGYNW